MSKKRHSHKRRIPPASRAHTNPPPQALGMKTGVAPPLSTEEQVKATTRMADLFKAVSAPPEGFLPWLDRLEIPYYVGDLEQFDEGNPVGQYLVISMNDLINGEERNQNQGSVLDRLSRKRIEEKVAERYDGNDVQNS